MSKRAKTYLAIAIATIVFIFVMRVWPYQLIKNPSTNAHANVTATTESAFLATRMPVAQMFVTAGDFIQEIRVDCNVYSLDKSEDIFAVLLDENKEVVFEDTISVKKIKKNGSLSIKPKTECTYGQLYTLELYLVGENSNISVKTADKSMLGQTEYTEIAQFISEGNFSDCILADYTYMAACTPIRMAFYYVVAIAAGVCVWFGITLLSSKIYLNEKLCKYIVLSIKVFITIALVIGYGYTFYASVIKNVFGGFIYDQIIYGIGFGVLLLFILYCVWKKKKDNKQSFHTFHTWIDYLQIVAIGLLLHCCVIYQNASRLYDQKTNLEWAGILLGLVIFLKQFEKTVEEIWDYKQNKKAKKTFVFLLIHGLLLVALTVFLVYDSQRYCDAHNVDAEALYLAKTVCWKNGIWAVVLLHTILYFRISILKNFSIPKLVIWATFAIWIWTHQYDYIYIKYIPVYFSIMMLQNWNTEDRKRLLSNFMNGMILAFFINLVLSLLYRPYQRWQFFRYPMYFHTVACTGEFLVAAEAAALTKLLIKLKDGSLKTGLTEFFLLGIVLEYQILSMARTAIISNAAIVLITLILYKVIYHQNWKKIFCLLSMIILSGVILFPTVFSATRIVPALVAKPYRFPVAMEIEFQYGIVEGDAIDDRDYMTFMRFLYCWLSRQNVPKNLENWIYREYGKEARIEAEKSLYLADSAYPINMRLGNTAFLSATPDTEVSDISNGRFEIWTAYIQDLNMTGHDSLGIVAPNGEEIVHAHNSFLQMAHSFGIVGGILFLLLNVYSFFESGYYCILAGKKQERQKEYEIYIFVILAIAGFDTASLTEWLSTMMIPLSMLFWLCNAIMINKPEKINERKKLRTV